MLTFAEEILLLILDDEKGTIEYPYSDEMKYVMAGAVLMDLAVHDKIDNDLDKLIVVDKTPTGEELLDTYLDMIPEDGEIHDANYWVAGLAKHGTAIKEKALEMLVEKGILKVLNEKILWVFGTRRYPMIDETEEREVRERVVHLLNSDDIPDPRDVILVCLIDTFKLFPGIVGEEQAKALASRITQIRKLDLIGQVVYKMLERLRAIKADLYVLHPY